jgi:pimeloyl-ACP methyl ester carboxylesterase
MTWEEVEEKSPMDQGEFMSAGIPAAMMAAASGAGAQSSSGTHGEAAPESKPPFFADNAQFWYELRRAFGAGSYGASEFGEVLVVASRIKSGDVDSWYEEWNRVAENVRREAAGQLARGHHVSARDSFLRAATYYCASEFFLHGNPRDLRITSAYQKSVECYKESAKLFDPPIEPVEIPYENTTLPGYFHRVDRSDRKRPLLMIHSGFDGGSAQEVHDNGARAAVERGYNVLAFDGPGHFGPLHREGLHFRPDWEKVVTPVVDFGLTLPGVDPNRIALMGISFGGELAPRAAAFEKRIAALIANDGVYDYGASNLTHVPAESRAAFKQMLTAKEAPQVDQMIEAGMNASPTMAWGIAQGMYAMGVPTPRAYLAAAQDYNLRNGIAEAISCPTLVCEAEADIFFEGNLRNSLTTSPAQRPSCVSPKAKARAPIARLVPAVWRSPASTTGSTKPSVSPNGRNPGAHVRLLRLRIHRVASARRQTRENDPTAMLPRLSISRSRVTRSRSAHTRRRRSCGAPARPSQRTAVRAALTG